MTVERCTWATSASKLPLQGLEAALEDGAADAGGELGLAFDGAVEARRPLGEGAVAVGHRRQLQRGDVVLHAHRRSEEHTSELQSLMRISYAVFCLQKKNTPNETAT